jgi:hypothetical protein
MKWAFISYIHPEDAYKYTPPDANTDLKSFATSREDRTCRVNAVPFPLKLIYLISSNIRPRDKPLVVERERERQPPFRQGNRDRSTAIQNTKPPIRTSNIGSSSRGPLSRPDSLGHSRWDPYPLLSKTLTVANLPPEFTPKDLYDLFSDFGKAEAAFMYAFPDAKGRRVGEVAMSSYLFAQKVFIKRSL